MDKQTAIDSVSQNGIQLRELSDAFRADKDVVMAAVSNFGVSLFHASPELKADKDVVMAAVLNNGRALSDADPTLRADKEVVMAAVSNDGRAFRATSLKTDPEVIIRASLNGYGPDPVLEAIASDYADNAKQKWEVVEGLASSPLLREQETSRLKNAAFDEAVARSREAGDDTKTQERAGIAAYQRTENPSPIPQANILSRLPRNAMNLMKGFSGTEEANEFKRGGTRRKRRRRTRR